MLDTDPPTPIEDELSGWEGLAAEDPLAGGDSDEAIALDPEPSPDRDAEDVEDDADIGSEDELR